MSLFKVEDIVGREALVQSLSTPVSEAPLYVHGRKMDFFRTLPALAMGSTLHFTTQGKWSTHELLAHLLDVSGHAQVDILTYSMTENPVRMLIDCLDSCRISWLRVVTDKRFRTHQPKPYQLATGRFPVYLTDNHAKVMLIYNAKWAMTVIGSANFTRNKRTEVGCIICDRQVMEHYRDNIDSIIHHAER
jgi:hypothetical protein